MNKFNNSALETKLQTLQLTPNQLQNEINEETQSTHSLEAKVQAKSKESERLKMALCIANKRRSQAYAIRS